MSARIRRSSFATDDPYAATRAPCADLQTAADDSGEDGALEVQPEPRRLHFDGG